MFSSDPQVITELILTERFIQRAFCMLTFLITEISRECGFGIQPKDWEEKDVEFANKQLEKLVYHSAFQFHRSKVQAQINETKEASDAVEKQKQRLVNQNKDMNIQLGNNEQEKVHLDKSVDANKLEHERCS